MCQNRKGIDAQPRMVLGYGDRVRFSHEIQGWGQTHPEITTMILNPEQEVPVTFRMVKENDLSELPKSVRERVNDRLEFQVNGSFLNIHHQRAVANCGFDLTNFGDEETFVEVLESVDIDPHYGYVKIQKYPGENGAHVFVWANDDGMIILGNNPITGEHASPEMRGPQEGYGSYIGIEGTKTFVDTLERAVLEKAHNYKDHDPRGRSFI